MWTAGALGMVAARYDDWRGWCEALGVMGWCATTLMDRYDWGKDDRF